MPRPGSDIGPSDRCPHCGADIRRAAEYACGKCGRFLDHKYRIEHLDPAIGRRLTLPQIVAEYRAVGWPLPGWLPQ